MSTIERQVRVAQHRLWFNRFLRFWGWCLLAATGLWTLTLLVQRLFSLRLPMGWIALGAFVLSGIVAVIYVIVTREAHRRAATVLDEAAGLKERVSSGLYVGQATDDPFAQAVVADADRSLAGLSARKFIPIRWPGSLSLSAMMVVVALLSLLLPEFDLLKKKEARATADAQQVRLAQIRTAIAKPVSMIQKLAEENADGNINKEAAALQDALKRDADPSVVRREATKQLDRLEDAIKNKADSERFKTLSETKKKLAQVGQPEDPKAELSKLMESVAEGDFKAAQQEVKKAQAALAKMAQDPKADKQKLEDMRKQLDELSQKLNKAAEDKQSERELKNAGLSDKEIQKALDAIANKDPKELEKMAKELAERLKDKGMTPEQMKNLLNKVQQHKGASKQLQKLAQKMNSASKACKGGQPQEAEAEMGQAGEMLSEMEKMEQEMNSLESQMSQLDQARQDMSEKDGDGQCKKCHGSGFLKNGARCPDCQNRDGNGNGRGRGSGPRDRDDSGQFGYESKKDKTQERKGGTVIGQEFVKSKQLKNKSEAELVEAAKAAEIDATDSLDRERIPRIYRKGVRAYFDRLGDQSKPGATSRPAP